MNSNLTLLFAVVCILLAYGLTGANDYDDEVRLAQEIRLLCQPARDLHDFRPSNGRPELSNLALHREVSTVSALRCRVLK